VPDPGQRPAGVGTALVEGLTSVGRYFAARDVRTVSGLLALHVQRFDGDDIPRFITTSLTEAVNGSSPLTAVLVSRLSLKLGLPHLRAATLLATAGELFVSADFRPIRQWCPLCIAETAYDPLVWSLLDVTVCPRHRIRLVSSPNCGHVHRPWALRAKPDECAACDMPLSQASMDPANPDPLTEACFAIIGWLQADKPLRRAAIAAGVQNLAATRGSNPSRLTKMTGLSRATVLSLRTGAKAPTLSSVARLVAYGSSLEDLLGHGDVEVRRSDRFMTASTRRQVPGLEAALRTEALLPPSERRSLAAIAADFGVGSRYPATHFAGVVEVWDQPGHRRRGRRPAGAPA
jgi:hypothetical protein